MKRLALFLSLALLPASHALAAERPAATVRVVHPQPVREDMLWELPGRSEPLEQARLFARASGTLLDLKADIGDSVPAGAVLALIDDPLTLRQVDAARAAVAEVEARAANANALARRTATLLATQSVSQEQADQRSYEAKSAAAALDAARAELARLETLRDFASLKAPFPGVVTARNCDRGDLVKADSSGTEGWLFELSRMDRLRFAVEAGPDLALRLAPGTLARIRFPELPGRDFAATVSRTSRSFATASGTMRVELELDNADLAIPAGLTGRASFRLPPGKGSFLVPTNAILMRGGQTFVALDRGGVMALIEVRTGRNLGQLVEIAATDLDATGLVILNPNALLRPGDAVKSEEAAKPAGK
jgi:RND family efflux transporter MFP subunit